VAAKPVVNAASLLVVSPHGAYRRPPDLSGPELHEAYEAGRLARALRSPGSTVRPEDVFAASPEWRRAYWLGAADRQVVPPPLVVEIAAAAITLVFAVALERRDGWRRQLPLAALQLGTLAPIAIVRALSRRRRARALDLPVERAPEFYVAPSSLLQLAIALVYQLATLVRRGRRPVPSASSTAAAEVTLVFMRERSWRRALGGG
jgi:hypothetical protein